MAIAASGCSDELAIARARRSRRPALRSTEDIVPCALGADEERALALGLREAVTNVVRHSRAPDCRITLDVGTRQRSA